MGLGVTDFAELRPVHQGRIWERMAPGDGPERLKKVIAKLEQDHQPFHMEGGSWTNDLSWVSGYEDVLSAMEQSSALFEQIATQSAVPTNDARYRNALFHLLSSQTSCYRYWGQGQWTDYGREICRRTDAILTNDF
jgi:hypothetical protein